MRQFVDSGELPRTLFDAFPDALVLVDETGRIAGVNARVVDLLGYPPAELLGQPVELLVADHQRAAHRLVRTAYWQDSSRRPMAAGRDLAARHKDGSAVSVSIALSPLVGPDSRYVIAVLRETPSYLRDLRAAEERYRSAIEQAPDAVFVADLEGRFTDVNAAACRMLGYARSELIGKTIMGLLPADELARLAATRTQLLKPGQVHVSEWTLIRADGVEIPVEVSAKIHPDGRWQAFVREIGHRKRVEAALSERDRLATVGTLAAGVGHEINNPLQHVTMTLELLRDALPGVGSEVSAEDRADFLGLVNDARQGAERIAKVVRGLHVFARGEKEESAAELSLVAVLELAISLTRHQLSHVQLFTDLRPTPMVFCDESRLVQVFISLLTNAAQATAGAPVGQSIVRVSCWTDSLGQAVVEVRDSGTGMTNDVRARIFEPFFTAKPVGHGSGLGLAFAHSIVTSLGGELSCESEEAVGSTFRATLPKSTEGEAPSGVKRRQAGNLARSRVLVVEDDVVVGSLIERALKTSHDVERAANGLEALALMSSQPAYDIIFCDLTMPHMNGIELYHRVLGEQPQLAERFVFMTGGATGSTEEFLERIPNEKLAKPFSMRALQALAMKLLSRAHRTPSTDPDRYR